MNIKWSFGGLNGIYAVLSQNQILTNLCVFCAIFFGEKSALVLIFTLLEYLPLYYDKKKKKISPCEESNFQ